jgi:hypothetical protein
MPYFVFRFSTDKPPALVSAFDKFKDAKELCRALRAKESPADPNAFRMAHANSEYEARRLLTDKRKPATPLEEWEA